MFTRLISLLILFINIGIFIPSAFAQNESEEEIKYFVVTAYYSPLPDQERYLRWNYEDEKKLNWNWIRWASGLEVFEGMFAWPKSYEFWTKIYLEWIWTWIIADRGWAIVQAWERWYQHDRIDVWMWHWDEWLNRALAWGKRTVAWKIIESEEWLSEAVLSANLEINLSKSQVEQKEIIKDLYNSNFWYESKSEDIKFFQEELKKRWLYNWEIDWVYNKEISDFVINFQIEAWIIKSKNEYWAWYWWKKTRNIFIEQEQEIISSFKNKVNPLEQKIAENEEIKVVEEKKVALVETKSENKQEPKIKEEKIPVKIDILDTYIAPESSKEDIKKLQEKLKSMDLYSGDINWEYKDLRVALIDFQLKNNVIKSENEFWAWYFWPQTRKETKKYYENFLAEKEKVKLANKKAEDSISMIWTPKLWDTWEDVRHLQKTLISLWYFEWKDTWYFWPKTRQSILAFQIDHNLVSKDWDPGSGKIWEKTKNVMKNKLIVMNSNENKAKNKILAMN